MAKSTTSPAVETHEKNMIAKFDDDISLNEAGHTCCEVQMWCCRVEDFSSQYGNEVSISYTMSNLEGGSNIYSQYGDFTQAAVMRTYGRWWRKCPSAMAAFSRSRGSFSSQDFVELSFEHSVLPTSIEVFETYNPGAVVRILACDKSGELPPRWHVLWEGSPQAPPRAARIFSPRSLRKCPFYTSRLRIEFHHSHLPYYAELDAVRLTGTLPASDVRSKDVESHRHSRCDRHDSRRFPAFESFSSNSVVRSLHVNGQNTSDDDDDGLGSSVDVPADERTRPENDGELSASTGDESSNETSSGSRKDFEDHNCAFFRLPMEILKIIFDYLDLKSLCSLCSTCRFFSQHCIDETQFYELDLQPYWHLITDDVLATMSQKFKRFREVDLSWCSNVSNSAFLSCLSEPRPTLTCLRLNCCPFVDCLTLETISLHCHNLRELRLQSCQRAKGSSFACLASLRELRVLDLYRTLVDTDSLVKIARSCQKLEHLNLGSCTNNIDCNRVAQELARSCPNLRSVDFWRSRGLTSVGLSALVRGCGKLEELDLGWCQLKSKEGCFREIAEHCPNLRKLFVTANRGLCNADLDLLSLNCQHLEQLDVLGTREITNGSILRLLDRCQALELLDLSFCAGVDYPGLEPVLAARPRVDIKRSFQGSNQAEEYLDRPARFQ